MYRRDLYLEPMAQGGCILGKSGFPLRGGLAHITEFSSRGINLRLKGIKIV
jgi:hypothetical protein